MTTNDTVADLTSRLAAALRQEKAVHERELARIKPRSTDWASVMGW
jgi:hypothetical protein